MKFNSQICTTVEQGRKLLDLGLRPEAADMVWRHRGSSAIMKYELKTYPPAVKSHARCEMARQLLDITGRRQDIAGMTDDEVFDEMWGSDIPAWSLARLLEILSSASTPLGTGWRLSAGGCGWAGMHYSADGGNVYDHVIGLMEWLVRMDCFCEDYLVENR